MEGTRLPVRKEALADIRATGGLRLLLIFFALEGVIGPRLSLFSWIHLPLPPVWLRVPILWTVFLPYLLWGFYQEVVYRGILQTELVRRWGSLLGILVSNLLFTFGPLHFYHFWGRVPWLALPVFTGIFLTGLFFGVLFRRSGNLAIVCVLHGLGNCYIDGLGTLGR